MDELPPENLSEVLARLFVARGWGRSSERARLESAWAAALGPEFLDDTRVGSLKRGVLEIEVKSGVLLQELAQFRKRTLIATLRTYLTGTTLTDIRFRIANW